MTTEIRAEDPQVLMVDDEKKVADAYALRLQGAADITVAYGGEEAIAAVDDGLTPDVVLLDRHMPGLSGDEVLERLRERELTTRVVMVTAIDPGLGILDMPFDDYLSKPVERADLLAVVDQQCLVLGYELLGKYFQLASKQAVLRTELTAKEADGSKELEAVGERLEMIEQRVRRLVPEAEDLLASFSGISREGH